MNCESWLPPKNSFMAATTGRMLISAFGVALSISWIVIRSRTTRSIRRRPIRNAFWISSRFPDPPIAEVVDVVLRVEAAVALDEMADDCRDVLARDRPLLARDFAAHAFAGGVELPAALV